MTFHRPRPLLRSETVSVVIPCYRYGHFLRTAVGSVLDQRGVDVEVIVIDDASDDDSATVVRALAKSDKRVRAIVHETNAGHIATYNEGLAEARGDYIVLLSADDAISEGSLERAVSLMQHHPRVGMVYGHAEDFADELPRFETGERSWSSWSGRRWLADMASRAVNPVYTPSVVMRGEAWRAIGRYDGRVPHAADMLLWFQTAVDWDIGRVNNLAQAYYRRHGSNMHLTQFSGMLRDLREQREVFRILFEEPATGTRPPAALRTAAHRALIRRGRRLALAEGRPGGDPAAAAAYRQFADETSGLLDGAEPPSRQTMSDRFLESRLGTFPRRALTHLEWRRWRRYGV
ncbi:glycosyltransferase family 2 protein [Microbacterium sp. I2]|jgi:glycosyltransferase involved in cell wall biosynthesis|uniref:glycosyltransferase family 2 protein n=1 Tax=Microbacterium sp. I2 TaxID=3391826 RepID=UPI003ED85602